MSNTHGKTPGVLWYDYMLPSVVATIHLPTIHHDGHNIQEVNVDPTLLVMPFPRIRLVEPFTMINAGSSAGTGEEEMIIHDSGDGHLSWATRTLYRVKNGHSYYQHSPEDDVRSGMEPNRQPAVTLARFNLLTRRRDHSFIEQPVSRQIRRHEGFSETYRDYIIVYQDEPQYHFGTPIRRLISALRRHHHVRGHLRRYWTGVLLQRPITVRPHERNNNAGNIAHPKTYVVR